MGDSLRVSRITFFAHGLACLEHTVTVKGDTRHIISVNPSAMADLLKTLTVHAGKGGVVKSVTYDAPPSRADIGEPVDISHEFTGSRKREPNSYQVLMDLVKEHIGSPMTVLHDDGSVTGRIMGTQYMESPSNGVHNDAVLLLQDDGLIVPVILTRVKGMRIEGPKGEEVAARVRRAANRGNIGVTIATEGDEERELKVRYAIEAPVYKMTYRVILLQDNELYIQAWAIVDNPSDEKLDDVEVVIIAGMPMSFRHDVYEARYISRPVEPVPKRAGFGARSACVGSTFGDGTRLAYDNSSVPPPPPPPMSTLRPHISRQRTISARRRKTQPVEEEIQEVDLEGATVSQWSGAAEASAIGSVHQYCIPGRVTIPARESALLPIITAKTQGGQVDLYVHRIRATNTLRAVKIENSTTAPFEKGPVAVYDEDALVGEGMLPVCQPGADGLMPYSVNLECKVEKRETGRKGGRVTESYASSGRFYFKRYFENVTIYDFSEQSKQLEVVVVHDRQWGYDSPSAELLPTNFVNDNTANGTKIIAEKEERGVSHFRITLEPGVKASLRVTEPHLESSNYTIPMILDQDMLASLTRESGVGKEAIKRLRRLALTKEEHSKVELEIKELNLIAKDMEATQRRYRENVMALSGGQGRMKDSGLVTEYAQRIRESENKIEENKLKIKEKEEMAKELKDRFERILEEFENNDLMKKTQGEGNSSS